MLEGSIHPDFARVANTLRKILPSNAPGGGAVCVYHHGEKVVDIWGGKRDTAGRPWEEDTLSVSFSTTKGVASTLLHIFADRGLIDYDAPVSQYWPEFAQSGKEHVTVRQLLCHEAGLYAIGEIVEHAAEMLDWQQMVNRLSAAPPRHPPGTTHGYHALTYGWLVGELCRRVSGQASFADLIAKEIAGPLELDGLYCGMPENQLHRCADLTAGLLTSPPEERRQAAQRFRKLAQSWTRRLRAVGISYAPSETVSALLPPGMEDLDMNSVGFRTASIPAANGMFTARSLARLYACLAQGGELDGTRLLSSEAVAHATTEQNRGAGRVIPVSMRWRLGYHRVFAAGASAPRAFGHYGAGGSGAFADPQRNLAVALTLNSGVGTPFGDTRIIRIAGSALRAAGAR